MRGGRQLSVQGSRFKVQGAKLQVQGLKSKAQSLRPVAVVQSAIRNPQSTIRGSAGFTLIEIMVVVFILGLLVTMVAPKIMGRTDEAKRTKAAADLRAIQQALNLYKLDNGRYPTTEQGLQALVTKPQVGVIPVRWNPEGYIEKVQLDPWENAYLYLSNGDRYTLKSLGGDGEEGGEGKDADLDSRDL
jgi:general secretion pathway protein G